MKKILLFFCSFVSTLVVHSQSLAIPDEERFAVRELKIFSDSVFLQENYVEGYADIYYEDTDSTFFVIDNFDDNDTFYQTTIYTATFKSSESKDGYVEQVWLLHTSLNQTEALKAKWIATTRRRGDDAESTYYIQVVQWPERKYAMLYTK
jgi:hypothetical protein